MDTLVSRKIIKPENCVLAFGVPTSEDDFLTHQEQMRHGFVQIFREIHGKRALSEYRSQLIDEIRKVEPILKELGLGIIHKITLRGFGDLLRQSKHDVVILFSHWDENNNAVEFADGFADKSAILGQIPESFSGIIDFCACDPSPMTLDLGKECKNCLIHYTGNEKVMPYFWINFYQVLFRHMKRNDITYFQAIREVVAEFSKKIRRESFYEKLKGGIRELLKKYRENRPNSAWWL